MLGKLKRYNGGDYMFSENNTALTITQKDLILKLSQNIKLIDTKTPGSLNMVQEKFAGEIPINIKL